MITLSILLTFAGFRICYQTSQRAVQKAPNQPMARISNNRSKHNRLGLAGLLAGLVHSVVSLGTGSGIFAFIMILTTAASLTVLLTPLGYLSFRNVGVVAVVFFLLELAL